MARSIALAAMVLWVVAGVAAQSLGVQPASADRPGAATSSSAYDEGDEAQVVLYDEWTDGEALTSTPLEIEDIYVQRRGVLSLPLLDTPIDQIIDWSEQLEEKTGLRMGFAYTMILQQASGGSGRRTGASGDLDIMGAWTLLGRGTPNTGQIIFSFEERHNLGPMPASGLRGEIGTLHPPTNGFNDRGFVVRDVYWIQRVLDGKAGFAIGRGDTSDFFGSHGMQSLNVSFSNRMFSANTVIPSPGHGMFAGFSVRPVEQFYVTAGGANAYGRTTVNDMKYLDEGDFFTFAEMGYTPRVEGLGSGRYRVVIWNLDPRDRTGQKSDRGISIIADQDIGETLQVFARYGYADEAITNIRSSVECGVGLRGMLGSPDNLTGLAAGYSEARSGRDEKVIETFHRWQLTNHTQLSLGVQGILDPNNSDDDAVAVFTMRFRVVF